MKVVCYILLCPLFLQACTVVRLYNGTPEEKRISIVSSDSNAFTSDRNLIERYKKSTRVTKDVSLSRLNSGCVLEFKLQPNMALGINDLITPRANPNQSSKFCILNRAGTQDTLISVNGNKIEKRLFTKRFKLLWTVYHYKIR